MGDFSSVSAELVAGVLNTHPSTTPLIKAAMVRCLANLQAETIPFMEVSGQFTTNGQAAYGSDLVGFPKSLLRFDRIWYDPGNYARFLEIVDPPTVRYLQEQPAQAYPTRVCWLEEKLQFGPAPNAGHVVKWDGILDATKDTKTGETITVASDQKHSNGWFTAGVVPFKHLVWADYFQTSPDQRPDLAASHGQLAALSLSRLREAGKKRQEMNTPMQVPNAFDNYRETGTGRLTALFPGAPI